MNIETILKRYQQKNPNAFISKRGISVKKGADGREVLLYGNRVAAEAWLKQNTKAVEVVVEQIKEAKVDEAVVVEVATEPAKEVTAEPKKQTSKRSAK